MVITNIMNLFPVRQRTINELRWFLSYVVVVFVVVVVVVVVVVSELSCSAIMQNSL